MVLLKFLCFHYNLPCNLPKESTTSSQSKNTQIGNVFLNELMKIK